MIFRQTCVALTLLAQVAPAMGHTAWDVDGDGVLSPDEFRVGFGALATHAAFDLDASGRLDEAEWNARLAEVGTYANMDLNRDGGVDATEYAAILFNHFDTDGSARIDATESILLEVALAPGGLLHP